jgi:SAM-dependent methyltransferase
MSKAAKHYEQLLAEHYIWMFGVPFEQKVAEQKTLLEPFASSLPARLPRGPAVDLGCGPGFQTIALAELGFAPVIAVDISKELLAELRTRSKSYAIETREADLASPDSIGATPEAAVIVCMGDTLTHLPNRAAVKDLFSFVFSKLAPGGLFVLTYRDLTGELYGTDRFFPVHADDSKIMTCFLEYKSEDFVVVNDLVYVREESGWELKKSSYEKLRLSSKWTTDRLRETGFEIERKEPAGRLLTIVARKTDLRRT